MYVSEITQFLRSLHTAHPNIAVEQKKGRAMWWDRKPQTPEDREQISRSSVAQGGYVYQTKV